MTITTTETKGEIKEDIIEAKVLDEGRVNADDEASGEERSPNKNLPLFNLVIMYTWEKIMILIFSILTFFPTYGIFMALSWKQYGLVDLIYNVTKSNRFFILLLIGKFLLGYISFYFIGNKKFFDGSKMGKIVCKMIGGFSLSSLLQVMFPILFSKQFNQDGSMEISSSSIDKVLIILALVIVDFINATIWANVFRKRRVNKALISHVIHSAKTEMNNVIILWFLYSFMIIVALASLNPDISENVRIFVFRIFFPIIKVIVMQIVDNWAFLLAKGMKMSEKQTAAFATQLAVLATIVCTLSQLFVINQSCYSTTLFVWQYYPHELIKKCSWFTDHPSFVKLQLKVVDLLKDAAPNWFKSKEKKVIPSTQALPSGGKRYTNIVNEKLSNISNSIASTQAGEDFCMLVTLFSVLSLFHNSCLYSISPLPSSIVQPSNGDVILCVLVIALSLETVTTIITFILLARAGIHVTYKSFPVDPINLGVNISHVVILILLLSAAMA